MNLPWLPLVLLSLLTTVQSTANSCSRRDLPLIPGRVAGRIIASLTAPGPMACAKACLLRSACESFSYEAATGVCDLSSFQANPPNLVSEITFVVSNISTWFPALAGTCANHICLLNEVCSPQEQPVCMKTGCLLSEIPQIDNANLTTAITTEVIPVGTSLQYDCGVDVLFQASALCEVDGGWTPRSCRLSVPRSCLDVQQCQVTNVDGEYWLTLPNMNLLRTRVYCHDMTSDNPKEFITLPKTNYRIFPNVTHVNCEQTINTFFTTTCVGMDGEAWYKKIRIDLATMTVNRTDYTFVDFSSAQMAYGEVVDCYGPHDGSVLRPCGTRGYLKIDLSGTGWIVSTAQQWKTSGYRPIIESITKSPNGAIIELKCGGFRGGCFPVDDLTLEPSVGDTPSESSAVGGGCDNSVP